MQRSRPNAQGQFSVPGMGGLKCLALAAGVCHSLLLLEDGSVRAFGRNHSGQCSVPGMGGLKCLALAAGGYHSLLLLEDGSVRAFGRNHSGQCSVPGMGGLKCLALAAGGYHSLLLLEDGSVRAFGRNDLGQCSVPSMGGLMCLALAAGAYHSLLLLEDGSVKAFGWNAYGQCKVPSMGGLKCRALAAGSFHNLLLLEDGNVWAFGRNGCFQCKVPSMGGLKCLALAAGDNHSLLLLEDGSVRAFGNNDCSQCSIPSMGGLKVKLPSPADESIPQGPVAPAVPKAGLAAPKAKAAVAGNGVVEDVALPLAAVPPTAATFAASSLTSMLAHAAEDVAQVGYRPIKYMIVSFTPTKTPSEYLREDTLFVMPELAPFMDELLCECGRVVRDRIQVHDLLNGRYVGLEAAMAFAITVYTYDTREQYNFYASYNRILRLRDFDTIRHLSGYSYYFLEGLKRLPAWQGRLYRGIPATELATVRANYRANRFVHWSSFSSASRTRAVAENMARPGGVIFVLQVVSGKDIREFSAIESEDEILLEPNIRLLVSSELTQLASGYYEQNLTEVPETPDTYVF
eukprot:TRINITY_DN23347_c0_g1_i7.p1 TRINITY_DN23347_c0_g1~~TRINITY_DN23347_c0_g1_i7.p1  ORF type:complete len:572 (-),score=117.59 TRINITY_DN23347_c0_g1_i7:35-1750(-)